MTPIETVARALVQERNKNLPTTDVPIDWEYISRNPENEWYRFYMGQARGAVIALAASEFTRHDVVVTGMDGVRTTAEDRIRIIRQVLRSIANEGKD